MKQKLLLAVMTLLLMATGLRAQIAYVVYCKDGIVDGEEVGSLHFLCATQDQIDEQNQTITLKDDTKLTYIVAWSGDAVTNSETNGDSENECDPGWYNKYADNANPNYKRANVTKVVFEESFQYVEPNSCYHWFYHFNNLRTVEGTEYLNTSKVTNMKSMFSDCKALQSLDLSNWDTSNVKKMHAMFMNCYSLTFLTLGNKFSTANVNENMNYMFSSCKALESLDLSTFDTSKVTDMLSMFSGCNALKSLVLGNNFTVLKTVSTRNMFQNCYALTSLNLSSLNTSNVTDMAYMFSGCSSLESITFGENFDTSNVTHMRTMFGGCNSLKSIIFGEKFNITKVTDMYNMFIPCSSLRLLDMSKCKAANIDFSKIEKVLGAYRPLTYVPLGTTVTENRENVVVGENCKHLVIDYDGTKNNQILLSVPYKFTAEKITINRDFVADNPHTLYLPFTMDAKTYGTFYTYGGYDNGTVTFNELTDATTKVNTPYLFKPKENGLIEITVDGGITVEANTTQGEAQIDDETNNETDADANGQFIGVYEKKTFTADEASKGIYYGWANGKFMRVGWSKDKAASVDACRAYLKLPEKTAGKAPANLSVKFDGDGTTGISAAKIGADGDMEPPIYNLQGQRVGGSYKGLVIKNGKKVIVK